MVRRSVLLYSSCLLGLISITSSAQDLATRLGLNADRSANVTFTTSAQINSGNAGEYVKIEKYLFKDPRQATVILFNGDTLRGQYRYNLEEETLEPSSGSKKLTAQEVKYFTFDKTRKLDQARFSNMKIHWPDNKYIGFFQDMESSSFVKVKHFLEFVPQSYNPSTQTGDKFDKIEPTSQNFLKIQSEKWIQIPESKMAFFDMFGVHSLNLEKYAKKNRLKLKRPEDIGKMVNWVVDQIN